MPAQVLVGAIDDLFLITSVLAALGGLLALMMRSGKPAPPAQAPAPQARVSAGASPSSDGVVSNGATGGKLNPVDQKQKRLVPPERS